MVRIGGNKGYIPRICSQKGLGKVLVKAKFGMGTKGFPYLRVGQVSGLNRFNMVYKALTGQLH